jgi:3-hydroxyisobutyrate dehydrogenase-like beta-hydroxyacid dehydrogenase
MSKRILFVGLGVMGYHMAGHLAKSHEVFVYNRSADKRERWLSEHSGHAVIQLQEIPKRLDCIMTCIGKDSDLEEVYLGANSLVEQASPNTILIDHTTSSAGIARRISAAAVEKNLRFIDAPVSGGEQGAINGQLTVMCGGHPDAFQDAEPLMSCFAKSVKLLGETGAGQLTKMCNQIAIAGLVQGLSESIHFAQQAGLDPKAVIDVISKGAAQSWQMDNRHETMIEGKYEHGFAVELMRKDLSICLDEARRISATIPVTALVDQFYADVQAMGGERWDTSSLLKRLQKD